MAPEWPTRGADDHVTGNMFYWTQISVRPAILSTPDFDLDARRPGHHAHLRADAGGPPDPEGTGSGAPSQWRA